ncbi:MAG: preprotein translocase subunit SecY [Erysipelotrichaceae bacterium]|nr:preprotein translocase subunit SecY [Erysipelotrichaceae bacterium]MBR5754731.1 preprotein translocase subunit SecY [Erysipelotrichaceae bacterium]
MFKTFIDFFKNKDLRKRILFTLFILFIFRLGSSIPAPGVNTTLISLSANSLLNMMNILGGGSIEQMSIFSLGVSPYITASIIIELLAMDIIPALTEMARSGKKGRQQMDRITRYLAVVMALVQGYFIVQYLDHAYADYGFVQNPGFTSYLYISVIFTAGTMLVLWLADQITTKGVGNGTSMIIFAGIVADMPNTFRTVYETFLGENATSTLGVGGFIAYIVMFIAIIVLVVLMQLAERRIPIQQSSSRALNKTKGDLNHLPLKVNSASVTPVIFASALIQGPQIIASWINQDAYNWLSGIADFTSPLFLCFYGMLIILFTFFYTNLTIDPQKTADDLGKNGQYIPGVRPGTETKNYISKVLNRITVLGSLLLTFIALLPYVTSIVTGLSQRAAVGGTGIIIVVGVAMDTIKQMKSQMTSKQYKSFVGK